MGMADIVHRGLDEGGHPVDGEVGGDGPGLVAQDREHGKGFGRPEGPPDGRARRRRHRGPLALRPIAIAEKSHHIVDPVGGDAGGERSTCLPARRDRHQRAHFAGDGRGHPETMDGADQLLGQIFRRIAIEMAPARIRLVRRELPEIADPGLHRPLGEDRRRAPARIQLQGLLPVGLQLGEDIGEVGGAAGQGAGAFVGFLDTRQAGHVQIELVEGVLLRRQGGDEMPHGAIAVLGADRGADGIHGGERALQRLIPAAQRAGIVEAGELLDQQAGLAQQAPADLLELDGGIASRRDLLDDIGDAAVVERQKRIEGLGGLPEIGDHDLVLEKIGPELWQFANDRRGNSRLDPGLDRDLASIADRGLVGHQMILLDAGIAQPERIVERPAVPIVEPHVALIELDHRGENAPIPSLLARFLVFAILADEVEIGFRQHEEEGIALLAPLGRGFAMGGEDPFPHQQA